MLHRRGLVAVVFLVLGACGPRRVVSDAPRRGEPLPGACVAERAHAVALRAADSGAEPDEALIADAGASLGVADLDLDGDGTQDVVLLGNIDVWEATYGLYVRRGACGHFVGLVSTAEGLRALPSRAHGLADLGGVSGDCPTLGDFGMAWCEVVYSFNGTRYVRASEKRTEDRHPER